MEEKVGRLRWKGKTPLKKKAINQSAEAFELFGHDILDAINKWTSPKGAAQKCGLRMTYHDGLVDDEYVVSWSQ